MGDMTVDELKDKKLWFLWSAKPGGNGKVTKVSFAANGGATGTDDAHRGTWVSFDDAESARNQFQASGLGLKIPKGFFLLDIDHKDISDPFAQLMLSRFSSYAEVSPSGKGIHIIGQCDITKLPVHFDDRRKKLVLDSEYYQKRSDIGLELYIGDITNRYGTFTGNTINSLPIADCTQAVLTTLDKEMRKKPKAKYSAKRDGDRAVFDIVCDLRKQKNGDKFIRLYDKGDFSEYNDLEEVKRKSEAIFSAITTSNVYQVEWAVLVLELIDWVRRYQYLISDRAKNILYSAALEPIPYLNVVAGRELNPNNPDNSWLLLKKMGTDSGKVLYAGTMVKIDKKYLVSPWHINDAAVEKFAKCLVDAINMAKKWLDETEGEFILDPDYYGII